MPEDRTTVYRDRIYGSYSSARASPIAPITVDHLSPRLPYFRRLVRRFIPTDYDCFILDLGCGHGALLHVLQQCGYRNARGVDGSSEQVDAAKQLGIAAVERGDVMTTLAAIEDETLDVVIAFDVIEHFTKSELMPLVDQVLRVLKPG